MNKRGSTAFLLLMLGVVILVLAIALASPINTVVQESRETGQLNCSDDSIDSFKKGACIISDAYSPYFIGILIALGAGLIGGGIKLR